MTNREPLTDDEKGAIHSLMEAPAWKLIEEKIWTPVMWQNIQVSRETTTDHRFFQGIDVGFHRAKQVILEAIKPKPEVTGTGTVNPIDESAFYRGRK